MSNRLGGKQGTAYTGTNANQPPNFHYRDRPPTQYDTNNYSIADFWFDFSETGAKRLWWLASLQGTSTSKGALADWIQFGVGNLETLSGDSGTNPVTPDALNNINVFGDNAIGLTVSGDGIHTLTITTTSGNPLASSFQTNAGLAVPDATGLLNVLGDTTTIVTTGAGNTITIEAGPDVATSYVTNPATGTAVPAAGVLTFAGTGGIVTSAAGSTVTIDGTGAGAQSFPTDSGTAIPAAGVLNINANHAANAAGSSVEFSAPGPSNTVLLNLTDANNNTILGFGAGNLTLTGNSNSVLGFHALDTITSGSHNSILGNLAASNHTSTESYNVVIGDQNFGLPGETGIVRIGSEDTGTDTNNFNTFVGFNAGNSTYTLSPPADGVHNTCLGAYSGSSLTTARGSTLIGAGAGLAITAGIDCVAVGSNSLQNFTTSSVPIPTSGANTAIGTLALNALTTGSFNLALGDSCGLNLLTGSYNCLIGPGAGFTAANYTGAESSNIVIGNPGVTGDNNIIRIGTTGGGILAQNECFVAGITGVGVTGAAVIVSATGQLGVTVSSERFKENIKPLADTSAKIYDLKPVSFNYKTDPSTEAYGLIAEQVDQILPHLVVHDLAGQISSVKYHELPVLLLNEIQKLSKRVADLEAKLAAKG